MPDRQIHPIGVVSAPGDYKIPDAAELLLKNAYAKFDGSGAAGDFRPLLRIISDAGTTLVESGSDTTIAAGASADASWFPHLAAAASAPSGGVDVPWAMMIADEDFTVDHSGSPNYLDLPAGDFYTNDSGVYSATSFTPHLLPTVGSVEIDEPGFYQVTVSGNWKPLEAAAVGNLHLNLYDSPTTSFNPGWVFGRQAVKGNDVFAGVPGGVSDGVEVFAQYRTRIASPPVNLVLWASQFNATVDATLVWAQIDIQRLSDPITGSIFFIFPPYN